MQYSSSFENYSSSTRDSPSKWSGKDDKGYAYKKSSYQFSNTANNNSSYAIKSSNQNIDQLDALLEDLKNERQITRERDLLSSPNNYKLLEKNEPYGTITKSTRVIKTSQNPTDSESFSTTDYNTLRSNGHINFHNTLNRDEYDKKDKLFSNIPPTIYDSKSKIYESSRTVNDVEVLPATSKEIETDLKNIALTDEILPLPGTKVTTTVRTYTYEIPAGGHLNTNSISRNQNILYKNHKEKESNNLMLSELHNSNLPPTIVYNTESYSTLNRGNERPIVTNQSYEIHEHSETNTLRNNIAHPLTNRPKSSEGNHKNQTVYNINTTEHIHTLDSPENYPRNESETLRIASRSPQRTNIGPQPTTNRYIYKETSNIVNTMHGPGSPKETNTMPVINLPPQQPINYSSHADTTYSSYGTPNAANITYKYTSTSSKNTKSGLDYGSPSSAIPPAPFPVDAFDYQNRNGNPPQKVEDLMQSFGNGDAVDKNDVESPHRKREIETGVASPNQPQIPTVNRAGKEVYYPPGQEMVLTKREEMASGSAGGGRWAKGSGMYEYESGYKSKTKTKSGGAMVPVCLPLCCAMPCSIM